MAALSSQIEQSMPIGGGQDLLARMKDYVTQPDRIVNVKVALESTVTPLNGGLRIGAAMRMVDVAEHAEIARMYPAFVRRRSKWAHRKFGIRLRWAATSISGRAAGTTAMRSSSALRRAATSASRPRAKINFTPSWAADRAISCTRRVSRCRVSLTVRRSGCRSERRAHGSGGGLLHAARQSLRMENVLAPDELLTHVILPAPAR